MDTTVPLTAEARRHHDHARVGAPEPRPVGGPVTAAWREGTLTRAKEIEALCAWLWRQHPQDGSDDLAKAIEQHLEAARQAATHRKPFWMSGNGSLVERAMGNLDAA